MEKANEVASFFLWLVIAIFVLHVIQGDALDWIKSKFTAAGGTTGGGTTTSANPGTASVNAKGNTASSGSGDVASAYVTPTGLVIPFAPSPNPASHGTPVAI